MGEGPYFTFIRPYHLTSLEVPLTCARVALYGKPDMVPLDRPVAEVCAVAKRDLKPGETLDQIGEYTYRAWVMRADEARLAKAIPCGLLEGGDGRSAGAQGRPPHLRRRVRRARLADRQAARAPGRALLWRRSRIPMRDDDTSADNTPFAIRRFAPETLREALRKMILIRRFEEGAEDCYTRGLIHGTMHLSIGQEASAVGICLPMEPDDKITSTHRGHGHCIAKGADVKRMFAEFFGKETGYCKGRGGSMHIADVEAGNLGANGIVGGGLPIAVGAAH